MLGQRRGRWPNVETASVQSLVFAGTQRQPWHPTSYPDNKRSTNVVLMLSQRSR